MPQMLNFKNFFFVDIICGFVDGCHGNATCTDTNDSYACVCNNGFTGDGFNCTGETLNFDSVEITTC